MTLKKPTHLERKARKLFYGNTITPLPEKGEDCIVQVDAHSIVKLLRTELLALRRAVRKVKLSETSAKDYRRIQIYNQACDDILALIRKRLK